MRSFLLLAFLLFVCAATIGAKRGRKLSSQSTGNGRSAVGESQVRVPGLDGASQDIGESGLQRENNPITTTTKAKTKAKKRKSKRTRKNKQLSKNRRRKQKAEKLSSVFGSRAIEDRNQKELLRSTIMSMFGFHHMSVPRASFKASNEANVPIPETTSSPTTGRTPHEEDNSNRSFPHPPDFMLELYRSYSRDETQMLSNSKFQGNTIRSFFSIAANSPHDLEDKGKPIIIAPFYDMTQEDDVTALQRHHMKVFAFNMTSIPTAESIVTAELRFDGRKNNEFDEASEDGRDNNTNNWRATVSVYRISELNSRKVFQRVARLVTITPSSASTWTGDNLVRLIMKARRTGHVLVVKFDRDEDSLLSRQTRSAPARDNNSGQANAGDDELSLPRYFVVVATDRSKRNSGDNRAALLSSEQKDDLPSLIPILIVYCNDSSTLVPATASPTTDEIWGTLGNLTSSGSRSRTRRSPRQRVSNPSVMSSSSRDDNEIPGESLEDGDTTTGSTLITDNDQTELHDNGKSQRIVMTSLQDRKSFLKSRSGKKKRKRRCRKKARKGKKSRKCKKTGEVAIMEPDINRIQQTCSRKSLHVDFADIGWADWIISPQNFDAYYCSGQCEFKAMKKTGASNHAILQSFIKAFEINPEVPAPCCVPEKLMSLTVLFFDENDNVVLKVYPNMSVETCACR